MKKLIAYILLLATLATPCQAFDGMLWSGFSLAGGALPLSPITDLFSGFNRVSGDSFTGGPTQTPDLFGVAQSSPSGVLALQGARYSSSVWYNALASGQQIWEPTAIRTRKGGAQKFDNRFLGYKTSLATLTTYKRPTANVLRPNDWGIHGRVVPTTSGQTLNMLWSSYVDSGNDVKVYCTATTVVFSKKIATVDTGVVATYTHVAGVPFEYQAFQSSVYGMGLRVKQDGGAWSAWATLTTTVGKSNNVLSDNYQIGARNGALLFIGNYPFHYTLQHADPKTQLISLATRYSGEYTATINGHAINWRYLNAAVSSSAITATAIYAATKDTLFKSTDGGLTWTQLLTFPNATEVRAVYAAANGSIYVSGMSSAGAPYMASTDTGLWQSTDGTNFTRVLTLGEQECIWGIDEDASGNIYAGVYHLSAGNNSTIYKSTDNGATWGSVYSGVSRHIHGVNVDKVSGVIYAVVGDNGPVNSLIKSSDSGATWDLFLTTIPQMTVALATPTSRLFGSDYPGIGRIYRTTDDATSTITLDTHYQNCFFLRRNPATGNIYAGFKTDPSTTGLLSAMVYVSTDDGISWTVVTQFDNLLAGEGVWFGSNFYGGKMIIGYKTCGIFRNGIILQDS